MTVRIQTTLKPGDQVLYWIRNGRAIRATVIRIGQKRVTIRVDGYPSLRFVLPICLERMND